MHSQFTSARQLLSTWCIQAPCSKSLNCSEILWIYWVKIAKTNQLDVPCGLYNDLTFASVKYLLWNSSTHESYQLHNTEHVSKAKDSNLQCLLHAVFLNIRNFVILKPSFFKQGRAHIPYSGLCTRKAKFEISKQSCFWVIRRQKKHLKIFWTAEKMHFFSTFR